MTETHLNDSFVADHFFFTKTWTNTHIEKITLFAATLILYLGKIQSNMFVWSKCFIEASLNTEFNFLQCNCAAVGKTLIDEPA